MRPSLLARVDEASVLDSLRGRRSTTTRLMPRRTARPKVTGTSTPAPSSSARSHPGTRCPTARGRLARELVTHYEFADERILRAVYDQDQDLLGRNMLLEGRFFFLRFYFGVRVTDVYDETQDTERGRERVWGWSYQTLQGHLEEGRISFEVIKNLGTGQVGFRVTGYSRAAQITDPLVRFGFRLFGRHTQTRYYAAIQSPALPPGPAGPARRAAAQTRRPARRTGPGPGHRPAAPPGTADHPLGVPRPLNRKPVAPLIPAPANAPSGLPAGTKPPPAARSRRSAATAARRSPRPDPRSR